MAQSIRAAELPQADVVIRPDLTGISSSNFESKQQAILQGERAALAAMPQLRAELAARMAPSLPTRIPFQPGVPVTESPRTIPSSPPPALNSLSSPRESHPPLSHGISEELRVG